MAKANLSGNIRKRTITTITDEAGNEVYTREYVEETIHDPSDNSVNTTVTADVTTLTSGESYNLGMSAGPNPIMLTGLCEACQAQRSSILTGRKTTGLTNLEHLSRCHRCGIPLCPRHAHVSKSDGNVRCSKCSNLHKLGRFLNWIFREPAE